MPKPLKPCKYGRNPVTGRCYTRSEGEQADFKARWLERELEWERKNLPRVRENERRLERARQREILAGRIAVAELQVAQRRAAIARRVQEAESAEDWEKVRNQTRSTAQSLLRQLARISGQSPEAAREAERLEESVRRTSEAMRQASEEAFYRRRPRSALSGFRVARPLGGIFG